MNAEKNEEKKRSGPLIRREAQSEAIGKQLEEELTKLQSELAHTGEAFQQLANCARNAYQTVTLGLVIAKAKSDAPNPQVQRVDWNEVAQRIFGAVTQLGVLQCSMEPKINFLQTGNRMRSVYDASIRLYLVSSETLQENFPCSPNSNKESIKPSRPVTETKTTLYDDGMEKLIKQERHTVEEKIVRQEVSLPENEMKIMRSWADSAKGKNEGRSKKKSTVVIVPKEEKSPPSKNKPIKKRCHYCKKRGGICPRCRKGAHPIQLCPLPRKRGRGSKEQSKMRRKMSHSY